MKKAVSYVLAIIMMLGVVMVTVADEKDITVSIDGKNIEFVDAVPYIDTVSSRTLVPMRIIFESLGAEVDWKAETRTVTARTNDKIVSLTIDSSEAYVNGEKVILDQNAVIKDDRTMVPLRFAAESLDLDVNWSAENRHISITKKAAPTAKPVVISSGGSSGRGGSSGGGGGSSSSQKPSSKDEEEEKPTEAPEASQAPSEPKDITLPKTVSWISLEGYDHIPDFGAMFDIEIDKSKSILQGSTKVYVYHIGKVTNNPETIKKMSIMFDFAVQSNGYGHMQYVGSKQHIYTNGEKKFTMDITNSTSNCDECYLTVAFTIE